MSEPPPRILDYADPYRPARNFVAPQPVEANDRASIPLAIGVFYLPICIPLGLVAYLLGSGAAGLASCVLPLPWAHAIGYVAAAACLSWPLLHGWSNGMKALAELRRAPARGYGQAVLGLVLCGMWMLVLLVTLCVLIVGSFDR